MANPYTQQQQQGYPQQGGPQQGTAPPGYPPPAQPGYANNQPAGAYPQPAGGYPPAGGHPQPAGGYPPAGGHGTDPYVAPVQMAPPQQAMGGGTSGVLGVVAAAEKLVIKQEVSLLEVAGDSASGFCCCLEQCLERPNVYNIFDAATGQKLLRAKEESEFCMRCCCNPMHELKLHITDVNTQQEVLLVDKPFKCMGCCPALTDGCRAEATLIENGAVLGKTRAPCCAGGCTPTVEVFSRGRAEPFSVVEGPGCCFAGLTEMCMEQNFFVSQRAGKSGDQAMILKEKPRDLKHALTEIATDSDTFTLTYKNKNMSRDEKLVLLSSLLLLDYLYFEENQPFECGPGSCSITCCYLFCGGCFCPCKCSCDGESE